MRKTILDETTISEIPKNMKLYTVPEVAKIMRVKKPYIYELIATQQLKAIKFSERRIRVSQRALDEYFQSVM